VTMNVTWLTGVVTMADRCCMVCIVLIAWRTLWRWMLPGWQVLWRWLTGVADWRAERESFHQVCHSSQDCSAAVCQFRSAFDVIVDIATLETCQWAPAAVILVWPVCG